MEEQTNSERRNTEEGTVRARPVSLLECATGRFLNGKKEIAILISLGHADASVDQIALATHDAKKLLYRLAVALGHENVPLGPATEQKIFRRWSIPHSVGRAELNVKVEEDTYLNQLQHDLPELGEYLVAQLNSLRRVLQRVGKNAAKPATLMNRIKRLVLVAVDAARSDT